MRHDQILYDCVPKYRFAMLATGLLFDFKPAYNNYYNLWF